MIRGYVVKIFGAIFHREALTMRLTHGNTTNICQCHCQAGPPVSHSAYISAIIIGVIRLISSLREVERNITTIFLSSIVEGVPRERGLGNNELFTKIKLKNIDEGWFHIYHI